MRYLIPLLFAFALTACGGSRRPLDEAWTAPPEDQSHPFRETEVLNPTPLVSEAPPPPAWLGVRHDLMLASARSTARCACLAVKTGPAGSTDFFWLGGAPDIGANALALAISARGVDCPGGATDETKRRPSISAVDQENDDIVVEVEELPEGRPLASGAVIPKPGPGGSVYIRPRSAGVVYAKSAGGTRCKVR